MPGPPYGQGGTLILVPSLPVCSLCLCAGVPALLWWSLYATMPKSWCARAAARTYQQVWQAAQRFSVLLGCMVQAQILSSKPSMTAAHSGSCRRMACPLARSTVARRCLPRAVLLQISMPCSASAAVLDVSMGSW